jgi:2-oxo-4-hydroxy-4-carboxy-5-ureidoimidazoline decarboxylase
MLASQLRRCSIALQSKSGISIMEKTEFLEQFGGIFEHSAWVAERAWEAGISEPLSAEDVHAVMCEAFRAGDDKARLDVLRAHPDLAGKLAIAGGLTEDSRKEQAGAGLDRLSAAEHARFTELNSAYVRKFGFPFIIAVKGLNKDDILSAFETRINNSADTELATACAQVERIALLRLSGMLPERV